MGFNPFMTKVVIIQKPVHYFRNKSMDQFLYDDGLHHERFKLILFEIIIMLLVFFFLVINVSLIQHFGFHIIVFVFGTYKSIHPEVFLEKGILKKCSKFTGKQPYGSVIYMEISVIYMLFHGNLVKNLIVIKTVINLISFCTVTLELVTTFSLKTYTIFFTITPLPLKFTIKTNWRGHLVSNISNKSPSYAAAKLLAVLL